MAKDDKANEAKSPNAVKSTPEPKVDLVMVQKGSEVLEVHPDALADHVKLGWKAE